MSDDNVVKLVQRSDGRLCKPEELPHPGSLEWSKLVYTNFIKAATEDKRTINDVLDFIGDDVFKSFPLRLLGLLLEMFATPMEQYHEKGKARFPHELQPDPEVIAWIISLMVDLCLFLKISPEKAESMMVNLTTGQVYTFYLDFVDCCTNLPKKESP